VLFRSDHSPDGKGSKSAVLTALAAGSGFGGFFILLAMASPEAGLWPLAGARISSISLVLLLALATRRALRPASGSLAVIVAAGVLDMTANVLYLLAQQMCLLCLVAVPQSPFTACTLPLVRHFLGERLQPIHQGGLASVALIAAS